MTVRLRDGLMGKLDQLRFEPTAKRVRAELGGATVVDSTRAVLIWEPRRVVPGYAVPADDVSAALVPAGASAVAGEEVGLSFPDVSGRRVLDPSIPFGMHTAEGDAYDVAAGDTLRAGAAFQLAGAELAGYVVLDFDAFDAWYEEDRATFGHPRDPFHRVDVLPSSRHVRLELDGAVLAESTRPTTVYETTLPTRFYLPLDDVVAELHASPKTTVCAYKGRASYYSIEVGGTAVPDIAWTYPEPEPEVEPLRGLVCFFDERVDVELDGVRRERPVTPWSPPASAG